MKFLVTNRMNYVKKIKLSEKNFNNLNNFTYDIPQKIINPPQQYSPKRPNKRLKSREESPDEVAATDARVRILQDYLQPNCVNVYIQLLLFYYFLLLFRLK